MNSAGVENDLPEWTGRRLDFDGLRDRGPVVAQALDNQWLPPALLDTSRRQPGAGERRAVVGAEFNRALVNGDTLIVNRAYLLNNEAVYRHFLPDAPHEERRAFVELLRQEVIVPFLLHEEHPAQDPGFDIAADVRIAWRNLLTELPELSCVRFSWDRERNAERVAELFGGFGNGMLGLKEMEPHQLAKDLGIGRSEAEEFKRGVLTTLADWVDDDSHGPITRNAVYNRFITVPDTGVHERRLREGQFVVPLKQLVDLQYNMLLPKVADLVGLTPPASPPRSALQDAADEPDLEALGRMLRGIAVDTVVRQVDGPNSYGALSLPTLLRLRQEEAWKDYQDALKRIERLPFGPQGVPDADLLSGYARAVSTEHAKMLRVARRLVAPDRNMAGAMKRLGTSLVIESPGSLVLVLDSAGHTLHGMAADVAAKAGVLVVRLVMEEHGRRKAGLNNLDHSVTLVSFRLKNMRKQWEELLGAYGRSMAQAPTPEFGVRMADQQVAVV
ncbi:hypothetical protein DN069_24515 [Streptacidiphilus pinicola]|uniref:Uncharacterized protein n=1 Tax=Streptacidiphilus pinicola TaxID=2219663 RepID=A0A2X0J6I9_9ACTN|nr:hypothetical protein [Streptacidiphilus pinicola]RAG83038.1 hypothetical protein DN069_24515 [Streptacidiphilus pinicola]